MYAQHFLRSRLWLLGLLVSTAIVWTQVSHAQVAPPFTTLHSFNGRDGSLPCSTLIQGKDGDLYGMTRQGGPNGSTADPDGVGTVFKITTSGAFTTLYSFSALTWNGTDWVNSDGAIPFGGLIQGKDGNLYGTTALGGTTGSGTVFKITTSGALTTLYTFSALSNTIVTNSDGAVPQAGLIQDNDGNLYGTTSAGGATGDGTVFKITTSGTLTTLHSFNGGDGYSPHAGLIQGKGGDLYGTTYQGGANFSGTIFKITISGDFTTLYNFSALSSTDTNADGGYPLASLIQGKDLNLYGTADLGGANGTGTVFKITASGDFTILYSFSAVSSTDANTDGAGPWAGLIQGKDSDLYGTTSGGGANHGGTVFKVTTSGALTTLYDFAMGSTGIYPDGISPLGGLIQGKDGDLYGTAAGGGANGYGTVFKLTMIPVITSFSPTGGPVGTSITLKGVNFTEATAVNFGTIPANFTINSDTSLTLTVPSPGAGSAKITVVNPFGKATSGGSFVMTPVITGFSPGKGPVGTSVTLKGANFTGTTAVMVGAVSASFTINSDKSLTLIVPTGAVTAKISVVNSFGTGVSAKAFTVTP